MFKNLIPFNWKAKYHIFQNRNKILEDLGIRISNNYSNRVFIFLAADYGNLGDVAITYAQHKFLTSNFPNFQVIEIPISCTLQGIAAIKNCIKPEDIITIVGGGNMGDLYPMIECFRQLVINNFKENKVICFPQTVDFKTDSKGQKQLKTAKKVYNSHPNLTLLARESKSYAFFKNHFSKNKIYEVPDIVMSLKNKENNHSRHGCIICLRDDKEKKLNKDEEQRLIDLINNSFKSTKFRDTHIGGELYSMNKRIRELFSIWDEFRSAECVVTDRLHGMIFCFITNTPAIVFLNNNHKIKSSYKWIEGDSNIHLIENFEETSLIQIFDKIKKGESSLPKDLNILDKYQSFVEDVKRFS